MRNQKLMLTIFLGLFVIACSKNKEGERPNPSIKVYEVVNQDVPIIGEFLGSVSGKKDISIRARAIGFLEGIHFNEGTIVKKNQLLYTIESQQYESESAAMQSKLAEAKTTLAFAKSDLGRIRPLAKNNAVSQSDLDAAVSKYDAAKANVEAAKANLRAANILLSYTKVKSPLEGIIGKTKAKVGDFVGQSPNPVILNVVSSIDTILVDFYITETFYINVFRNIMMKERDGLKKERQKNNLELVLVDGSVFNHKGSIKFIDREVDPNTGAILLQAIFPNPDKFIRPGQYAKIRATIDVVKDGILIPQRCVMELQGKHSVFVVNNENKIEQRQIEVGPTIKNNWLVKEGLQNGDKVVYEGLQKVRPGVTVNPEIIK